ncbi:hypothetical protein [Paludibaculum fermentans]|uniref:hypothetical protein n=1 Tax=Paludibaculum fermentans TaxID=1473598 RepID=UPI003EC1518F
MKNGDIHRELNRSFYFAHAYDYPLTVALGPTGRVVVIHCPNSSDTIEVEDAETASVLVTKKSRDMEFHSRLAVSPDGRYLLDAGWFWHPLGGAWVCDLAALLHPDSAGDDGKQSAADHAFSFGAEIDSAAFLGKDEVVLASTDEVVNDDIPATGIGPRKLGVWSIDKREWRLQTGLVEPAGTIMPWGEWVISFYECPKAIEIASGAIVHRWDNIYSGKQVGSIELGTPAPPPMALDPQNGRFAVGGPNGVTVVTLSVA